MLYKYGTGAATTHSRAARRHTRARADIDMRRTSTQATALALLALIVVAAAAPQPGYRRRRQLPSEDTLQPLESDSSEGGQVREKRKLEGFTQAKFGVKNAVLGLVFGTGTTSHRARTVASPRPILVTPSLSISSNRLTRQASTTSPAIKGTTDDIPVFDRNKVSLDFPGNLFGPSVSLLIKTTKIVGDVIMNSAVRYQSFLRLFQPLFRGPFEIKGLEPATTTTTTTTAAPASDSTAPSDNEVRRRRHSDNLRTKYS